MRLGRTVHLFRLSLLCAVKMKCPGGRLKVEATAVGPEIPLGQVAHITFTIRGLPRTTAATGLRVPGSDIGLVTHVGHQGAGPARG